MFADKDAIGSEFKKILGSDVEISTGLASIKTLYNILNRSTATTAKELSEELRAAAEALEETDYSSTSIRSACELFTRFISLAPADLLDDKDFTTVLNFYRSRGDLFIERIAKSRTLISDCCRPFFKNNSNILTHSYSKVVLKTLLDAREAGIWFHVYVTESQPDSSGRKMLLALREKGIHSTLVLDAAVGYVMERMDMCFLGAEGVMETGGIINKIGTLNLAVCAKYMNKPVYVMAESIKFVKEYPLNQADIPADFKYSSTAIKSKDLQAEHPQVDYTPPQFITLIFTDLGIMTPAAVGEELIKLYT
ncbi:unnamed protein product, partial [Mesorhabditis belari]|uniref:Translation initiation factor eIF2B subunit alpha n=1 Tax=Mesorhabditis belari TaxID=2138241 RepID=A0AAF3E9E1_9BILA